MKFFEYKKEFCIQIGNTVRVTDPSYSMDVNRQCVQTIKNMMPGGYACFVKKADLEDERWGDAIRVAEIEIRHTDYQDLRAEEFFGTVTVDSGLCGIFDKSYFVRASKDETWIDEIDSKISRRYAKTNKNYHSFTESSFYKPEYEASLKHGYEILKHPERKELASECGILDDYNKTISTHTALFAISVYSNDEELHRAVQDYCASDESKKQVFYSGMFTSVEGKGIASDSGVGDGQYDVYVGSNASGQVVSVRLDYFGRDRELELQAEEPFEDR